MTAARRSAADVHRAVRPAPARARRRSGQPAARGRGRRRSDGDEMFVTCHLLLVAGFETTVNLIGNGTAALLDHPEQWGALRADPDRAAAAVEEVLRYDPPVQSTYRSRWPTPTSTAPVRAGDGVETAARRGQPRSQGVRRPGPVRHRPGRPARPPGLLRRYPLLRRRSRSPGWRRRSPSRARRAVPHNCAGPDGPCPATPPPSAGRCGSRSPSVVRRSGGPDRSGPLLSCRVDQPTTETFVGLRALRTLHDLELHPLALVEGPVPVGLDRRVVDEDVLTAVDGDEAVTLFAVEPLHGALCHVHSSLGAFRSRTSRGRGLRYSVPLRAVPVPGRDRGATLAKTLVTSTGPDATRRRRPFPGPARAG